MLLIDASVWSAMVQPNDRYQSDARALLLDSHLAVAALDLTLYEVANAVGVKMREPGRALALERLILTRCTDGLLVQATPDLLAAALEIAAEHGLTAYDAAYVAAARRHDMTLVSADLRDLVAKGLAVAPDAAV